MWIISGPLKNAEHPEDAEKIGAINPPAGGLCAEGACGFTLKIFYKTVILHLKRAARGG